MVAQSDPPSIPSTKKTQKKPVSVGSPLTKLSGSAHDMQSLNEIGTISRVMVQLALSLSIDLIIFTLLILQSYFANMNAQMICLFIFLIDGKNIERAM